MRAYIAGASHRGLRADELDELCEPWLTDEGRAGFYRQIAAYDERYLVDNEERLAGLDLPVRVLWGTEDTWIPIRTGRRLAALVPGAEFAEIAGAGHLVQYDAPVALATELRTWLTRRSAS